MLYKFTSTCKFIQHLMHIRDRYIVDIIDKKLRAFAIVGVLGARQVGKSTLLRDLIAKPRGLSYLTLDRPNILSEARSQPESFILSSSEDFSKTIIVDEAHKAPDLFDVLKVLADERRKRGAVMITGSVDFMKVGGVREALTGRLGLTRLYPLTIGEMAKRSFRFGWGNLTKAKTVDQSPCATMDVDSWLERGGMPAICQLGDKSLREELIEEWLQSICYRDLPQLKGARYDGALAREVLGLIAKFPEASEADIARRLGEDARRIRRHTQGLEALFVIYRISPLKAAGGDGFDRFTLLDPAVARYLGAEKRDLYRILVVNEILAQHEYSGNGPVTLHHFSKRGRTRIDLVIATKRGNLALAIHHQATIDQYLIKRLEHAQKLNIASDIHVLSPTVEHFKIRKGLVQIPYRMVC